LFLETTKKDVDGRDKPGHDESCSSQQARQAFTGSPIISGCRANPTAGEIRITSACAPKIATAR